MANETVVQGSDRGSLLRYGNVSVALHWAIALLILVQIGLGWWFNEVLPDHSPQQRALIGIHVSIGLTVLILVLVRIGVRLTHPAPPLPAGLATWERLLARTTHGLFYVLMLALPLTGWAIVSAGKRPILFWGIPWPHLPGIAAIAADHGARKALQHVHVNLLIWVILINLALHVAGALKHQFDGNPVLWRMIPFLRPAARPGN
ncbi:MAG: cytochrome b [Caulobacteraceae bacterium]|nr:cytochrome b [Caulobacteraceae bacterium]